MHEQLEYVAKTANELKGISIRHDKRLSGIFLRSYRTLENYMVSGEIDKSEKRCICMLEKYLKGMQDDLYSEEDSLSNLEVQEFAIISERPEHLVFVRKTHSELMKLIEHVKKNKAIDYGALNKYCSLLNAMSEMYS